MGAVAKSSNESKQIVLQANSAQEAKANMAYVSSGWNAAHIYGHVSDPRDLYNWVLDSGCTCHMSPYLSDFMEG